MRTGTTAFRWILALVAAVALAGAAQAQELRYAIGYPPGSVGDKAAKLYADALKEYSGGKLTVKVYALSLLNFLEASAGVRDGLADSSLVLLPYFSAEYPSSNLAGEVSMLLELTGVAEDKAGLAYGGAMSEYIFHHCPSCVSEFARQNQVFTGGSSSSPYALLCNKPVRTAAELKGKRLRIGGAQWARWAASVGAAPVSMSVNDVYEALNQGVVDCTIQSTPELSTFSLMEVTSDITISLPGGVFGGTGTNNLNAETWRRFSPDERRTLLRASAVMSAQVTWLYGKEAEQNMQKARELARVEVHEAEQAVRQHTHAFIEQDMQTVAENYRSRYSLQDADQMIATFRSILEKWVELVQDIDSGEALAELYWQETFSKVDVTKYGL